MPFSLKWDVSTLFVVNTAVQKLIARALLSLVLVTGGIISYDGSLTISTTAIGWEKIEMVNEHEHVYCQVNNITLISCNQSLNHQPLGI